MGAVRPLGRWRAQIQSSNGRAACAVSECATCRALRTAAVALAVRVGIQAVTSQAIAAEAGIGAERAAEHYPTLDHCLTAAFDEGTSDFREVCARALDGNGSWQERLHAAADATVAAFDAEPELARYCVVEVWRSNLPLLRACRIAGRRRYIEMMADHRRPEVGEELPDVRMEMFVGAGHYLTSEELERGDSDSLRERLDQLIEVFEPAMPSPAR